MSASDSFHNYNYNYNYNHYAPSHYTAHFTGHANHANHDGTLHSAPAHPFVDDPASHPGAPYAEQYFDDAFDNVFLATAGYPHQPFTHGWQPSPPPPPYSPSVFHNLTPPLMAPSSRPSRLPNGYVDLTSEAESTPAPPRRSRRHSPTPGPSSKRQRREDGTATASRKPGAMAPPEPAKIEEIDLSGDNPDMLDVLQKARTDAVQAQKAEDKPTTFNTFTCVICMDTPTDITATSCGHLFCHTCLMEALIAGENRAHPGEQRRSQCPVCRKQIQRTKQSDIIPLLLLKKGLATQPRKSSRLSTPKSITKRSGARGASRPRSAVGGTRHAAPRNAGTRRAPAVNRGSGRVRDVVSGHDIGTSRYAERHRARGYEKDYVDLDDGL